MVLPTCKMDEKVGTGTIEKTDEQPVSMAIICLNATVLQMSDYTSDQLKKKINDAIEARNNSTIPLFNEFIPSTNKNYIRVICGNNYSRNWLIEVLEEVNNMAPFDCMTLRVIEEKDVPELRRFLVYCPELTINMGFDIILKRINRTTPSIETQFWKIRKIESCHPFLMNNNNNGLVAELELDAPSIRLIEEMNYEVHVGIDKAYFWDYINRKGHPEAKLCFGVLGKKWII